MPCWTTAKIMFSGSTRYQYRNHIRTVASHAVMPLSARMSVLSQPQEIVPVLHMEVLPSNDCTRFKLRIITKSSQVLGLVTSEDVVGR